MPTNKESSWGNTYNGWFLCLVERQKRHYRSAKKRCLVQHVLIQANLPAHGVWLTLEGYKGIIHEKREADKVRRGGKVFQVLRLCNYFPYRMKSISLTLHGTYFLIIVSYQHSVLTLTNISYSELCNKASLFKYMLTFFLSLIFNNSFIHILYNFPI